MFRYIRFTAILTAALAALPPCPAWADEAIGMNGNAIDELARDTMRAFDVPGMAIGVVKDGETVYLKGHGVRELGKDGAVDEDTMFKIASNSKAFTSAALGDGRALGHRPAGPPQRPGRTRR